MSNFELAIPIILLHEGGFVNDPQDLGGATNYGVSLRWLCSIDDLDDDGFCDGDINEDGKVNIDDIKTMQRDDAVELYREYWWDKYQYSLINDQNLATKVFDLAVNMGAKASHLCLQRAVRAATGEQLVEDGIIGAKTLAVVNHINPVVLLAAYRSEAAGYYRSLNKSRFLIGWLNRAYS